MFTCFFCQTPEACAKIFARIVMLRINTSLLQQWDRIPRNCILWYFRWKSSKRGERHFFCIKRNCSTNSIFLLSFSGGKKLRILFFTFILLSPSLSQKKWQNLICSFGPFCSCLLISHLLIFEAWRRVYMQISLLFIILCVISGHFYKVEPVKSFCEWGVSMKFRKRSGQVCTL